MNPMALQAERAHVREIAFAAAFGNGYDVVGIPKGLAAFQTPSRDGLPTRGAFEAADVSVFGDAIGSTQRANSLVAFEDAVAQVARIATKTPFFDTEGGTESLPAGGHFQLTPTAETTSVGTLRDSVFRRPAAGHGAFVAHKNRIEPVPLCGRSLRFELGSNGPEFGYGAKAKHHKQHQDNQLSD